MARPTLPAEIIAQRGKPIKLIDGTTVTVVFTFSSLMRIEEDFGSMAGALEAVNEGERGPAFTSLAQILATGLEHVDPIADGDRLDNLEVLRALLDPMLFADYSDALGEAFAAAFPQPEEGEDEEADPTKDSRGESGTTSRPSSSDAASASSGA